jgi:hypothetical protein
MATPSDNPSANPAFSSNNKDTPLIDPDLASFENPGTYEDLNKKTKG